MTTFTQLTPTRLLGDQPLGKPRSMTDEQCGTLYIRYIPGEHPDEPYPRFLSRWTLTDQQRADIAAGHDIFLSVIGEGHPPVMLYTADEAKPTVSPDF